MSTPSTASGGVLRPCMYVFGGMCVCAILGQNTALATCVFQH